MRRTLPFAALFALPVAFLAPAASAGPDAASSLYAGWSYKDAAALEKAYGKPISLLTDKKAFAAAANPDPAWIPGWKSGDWTRADENAAIALQGAANKTWIAACAKDYEAFRAADAAIAAQFRPELDRLAKESNWYAGAKGWVELAKKVDAARLAAKLGTGEKEFRVQGDVGFGWEVAAAAVAWHKGSSHAFSTHAAKALAGVFPTSRLAKEGRPFSADAAFERDRYCAEASDRGTPTLPKLPVVVNSDQQRRGVTWPEPTKEDVARTLRKREEALRAEAAEKVAFPATPRTPFLVKNEGLSFDNSGSKIAHVDRLKVTKVTATGFEATREETSSFDYACTKGKINGINADGKFTHDLHCKEGTDRFHLKATIAAAELPPGLTLQVGDEVDGYVDVKADATKPGKKAVSGSEFTRTIGGDLRHVVDVTRKGKSAL